MANFLISYDQHRDRDYTPIWDQLHQWGAVRLLESLWVVSLNSDTANIRGALRAVTQNRDSLVVIQLQPGSEWSAYAVQTRGVQWMEQNIQRY